MKSTVLLRKLGITLRMPSYLTLSVTNKCMFRCKTCNIWKKNNVDELSSEEYKEIFKRFGGNLDFVFFTGGEPFVREDLILICKNLINYCSPKYILFFTSGEPMEKIYCDVKELLSIPEIPEIGLILSLDSIGDEFDKIRNYEKAFHNVINTYLKLRKIDKTNFTIGISTLYSKYNISNTLHILNYLRDLYADIILLLPAWGRNDLGVCTIDVFPKDSECISLFKKLSSYKLGKSKSKLTNIMKKNINDFYNIFEKLLISKKKILPCRSGFDAAFVNSNGEIMDCPISGRIMGDLKLENYEFSKVWFGRTARIVRKEVNNSDCWCPMLSDFQTNFI